MKRTRDMLPGGIHTMIIILLIGFGFILSGCNSSGGTGEKNTDNSGKDTVDTHTISGTITGNGGDPLAGVIVELSGDDSSTATTDTHGNYSFPNLTNGTYTLTPSITGHSFAPSTREVKIDNADSPSINFVASSDTSTPTLSLSRWKGTCTQEGVETYPMELEITEQDGASISGILTWTWEGTSMGLPLTKTRFRGTVSGASVSFTEYEYIEGNGVGIPCEYEATLLDKTMTGTFVFLGETAGSFHLTRQDT